MIVKTAQGSFGATIDVLENLSAKALDEVFDALYEHRVLLIKEAGLDSAKFVELSRRFGDPIPPGTVTSHRLPDHLEIIRMTNSPSTPPGSRNGATHWHSDSIYEAIPASVTLLYGIETPMTGGVTMFADCVSAYEALPEDLKQTIAGLRVIHDPCGGKVDLDGEYRGVGSTKPGPVVTHPLVLTHPVTGRIALFAFSATAVGIEGWEEEEALGLLRELKAHVVQPQFRCDMRVTDGSILMWDNYSVLHSATVLGYSDAEGKRRVIHRISTRATPAA